MAPDGAAAKAAFERYWETGRVPAFSDRKTEYGWIFLAGFRAAVEASARLLYELEPPGDQPKFFEEPAPEAKRLAHAWYTEGHNDAMLSGVKAVRALDAPAQKEKPSGD